MEIPTLAEYRSWASMKSRCFSKTNRRYRDYGGRGITVCDRWKNSFEAFYLDMGPRPPGVSLDRIDVNGNYEPGNCRWATMIEQNNNRTNTIWVMFNGVNTPLARVSTPNGIDRNRFCSRVRRGQSVESALLSEINMKAVRRRRVVPDYLLRKFETAGSPWTEWLPEIEKMAHALETTRPVA